MNYKIGDSIRKKIEEKGITFVSFADKFGITDRNLQYFFKRDDISMQQITRASEILEHDFVKEYLGAIMRQGKGKWIVREPEIDYGRKDPGITTSLTLVAPADVYYRKFSSMLQVLIKEANNHGFSIV